eukprot:Plantae.Rhodophyta-Purpureofilum_apyrenoidigerum.ctg18087.p1 GENE.Plantae.Rhodophyta-Purpureofilum_apyrenoidigerum.ctg18087~~Plantae.Rhodophyta-Purpureofilum_apyrenoidigerum.ctg18087.p1  ORF type:complete len:378 (-),score=118.13 Plantae.Rhodophyta-Purpureofilum_apyrenoidigerum.ctg18087:96-1148(-)
MGKKEGAGGKGVFSTGDLRDALNAARGSSDGENGAAQGEAEGNGGAPKQPVMPFFVNPFEGAGAVKISGPARMRTEEEDKAIDGLKNLQNEYETLGKELEKEEDELYKRFDQKMKDVLKKRTEALDKTQVSEFWLNALRQSSLISGNITERDEEALIFLTDICCDNLIVDGSFTLTFKFSKNPFFENKELTKTYEMDPEEPDVLIRAIGCTINWNPSKDLTTKVVKKRTKKNKKAPYRTITKVEVCDSFFNFFQPPQMPDGADDDDEEKTDADRANFDLINEILEADYELGEKLRSAILPNAVKWYLGEEQDSEQEELDDYDMDPDGVDDEYGDGDEVADDDDDDDDDAF